MQALTHVRDVLDLIGGLGFRYEPQFSRLEFRQGGELTFKYNPGVELEGVIEAFEKFHYEYSSGSCKALHRKHDSDGVALLLAASGAVQRRFPKATLSRKLYLLVGFSECGEGRCAVEFFATASSREQTERGFELVRKFFTEGANRLLRLERWERLWKEGGVQEGGGVAVSRIWRERVSKGGAVGVPEEVSPPALRTCMICRLGFRQGDLLAWCPFCGAPAHRLHLLEFLHVKENCLVCGHHLGEQDLGAQLGRANLRLSKGGQK